MGTATSVVFIGYDGLHLCQRSFVIGIDGDAVGQFANDIEEMAVGTEDHVTGTITASGMSNDGDGGMLQRPHDRNDHDAVGTEVGRREVLTIG